MHFHAVKPLLDSVRAQRLKRLKMMHAPIVHEKPAPQTYTASNLTRSMVLSTKKRRDGQPVSCRVVPCVVCGVMCVEF
jgi:hypothetical protein